MTDREYIIAGFSGREIDLYLSIGGVIPSGSLRRIRKRFGEFTRGVSNADLGLLDWSRAVECEIPAMAMLHALAAVEAA